MGTRVYEMLVLGVWVICLQDFCIGKAIQISGKLDLKDTSYSSSMFRDKKIPTEATQTVDTIISPSETIDLSCGSSGCITKSNSSVETEVVIRVKTNVNLDRNHNKKNVEHIPDVPVLIGVGGSASDRTLREDQFRYSSINMDATDTTFRRDSSSFNRPFNSDSPAPIVNDYEKDGIFSDHPYYHQKSPESMSTGFIYESTVTFSPLPLEYYRPSSIVRLKNDYYPTSPRSVEMNRVNSAGSALVSEINEFRSRDLNTLGENRVKVILPHLYQFNMHYFGEDPPQHFVANPSNINIPVAFKNIPKNKWRPSSWNGKANKYEFTNGEGSFRNSNPHSQTSPTSSYSYTFNWEGQEDKICPCKQQKSEGPSSNGPAFFKHRVTIDDKLAPLN